MNDTEKPVVLIQKTFDEQYTKRGLLTADHTADYLIAHGVTVRQRQKPIAEGMNPLEKCEQCPNFIFEDVQAYIQMLVAQNAELVRKTDKLQSSMGQVAKVLQDNGFRALEELLQAYSQVKRERDAALHDMKNINGNICLACKNHYRPDLSVLKFACKEFGDLRCQEVLHCGKFEWRGVPEPPEEA